MEIDKTTLDDLSVFNQEETFSVFNKINLTLTSNGKDRLHEKLCNPLSSLEAITGVQQTLRLIISKEKQWPIQISNGTIKVVERFYETSFDPIPANPTQVTVMSYKLLHGPDFSLLKYSLIHCFDFIKGMQKMLTHFLSDETPAPMRLLLLETQKLLHTEQLQPIVAANKASEVTPAASLKLGRFLRYHYKHNIQHLLSIHAQLDAWYGMAMAVKKYDLAFPVFVETSQPFIEAKDLYHILLENPVSYDLTMNRETNFLFLTGANMAGKSTFIKSVGSAVFMAHVGMGVPASSMSLGLFNGILSNINVIDNIIKGESYFFNEVQRIKATIQKVNDGRKWLILIDELFKGTNVQDAMKCSSTVIEGLLKMRNSLFILSTHLYEIAEALKVHPNINFCYFETSVLNDQLQFNYKLRPGISNDRLGYLILEKEGVVKMLEDL